MADAGVLSRGLATRALLTDLSSLGISGADRRLFSYLLNRCGVSPQPASLSRGGAASACGLSDLEVHDALNRLRTGGRIQINSHQAGQDIYCFEIGLATLEAVQRLVDARSAAREAATATRGPYGKKRSPL